MVIEVVRKYMSISPVGFIIIASLMFFCDTACHAQKNAILIQMDNDYLTDQYYTAGLSIDYLRSFFPKNNKQSANYQLKLGYNFQIYTPSIYDEESYEEMTQDRPFAGGHFFNSGIRTTSPTNKVQDYSITVGFIGHKAKAKEIQKFFHGMFGFDPEIVGWQNQVVNQWVVNLDYRWLKEWQLDEHIAFSTSSIVELGLVENSFRQGINFRLGKFKDLNRSSWLSPKRAADSESFIQESYFNFGFGLKYMGSNIFLEGQLSDMHTPISIEPLPFKYEGSLGIFIGNPKVNFALNGIFQGREIKSGKGHFYIALIVGKAF